MFNLEICIDSLQSAIIAQEAGADRVELCADLLEGGITPSYGMIKLVRKSIKIDLAVMIRPRGGDFCYSDQEFSLMKEDILLAKDLGANCLVFGILTPNGHVDIERTSQLVELTKPLQVTFHRAFDLTRDPFQALEDIITCGADRILTSGQQQTAILGKEIIKDLVIKARQRISIMAGSGVNPDNKVELLNHCGVKELHLTAKKYVDGDMKYRPNKISMSSSELTSEYERTCTDYHIIHNMRI